MVVSKNQNGGLVKGAAYALGISVPLITGGLAYLYNTDRAVNVERYQSIVATVEGLTANQARTTINCATSKQKVAEIEGRLSRWIGKIERNAESLSRLSSDVKSRPDPFTGTEGRELDRRITRLEACCDAAKQRN